MVAITKSFRLEGRFRNNQGFQNLHIEPNMSDADILDRYDRMSPKEFFRKLRFPSSRREGMIAGRYLGILCDENRRAEIAHYAEQSGLMDDSNFCDIHSRYG